MQEAIAYRKAVKNDPTAPIPGKLVVPTAEKELSKEGKAPAVPGDMAKEGEAPAVPGEKPKEGEAPRAQGRRDGKE